MKLKSPAFGNGDRIPVQYTGDGTDLSPPLEWEDVPESAAEFALICQDPDAPTPQPWVHWILHGIPAGIRSLPEAISRSAAIPGEEGLNSWKSGQTSGYRGPAPPRGHGTHHYHFHLYALNTKLSLTRKTDRAALLKAMMGHIAAEAEIVATYERP